MKKGKKKGGKLHKKTAKKASKCIFLGYKQYISLYLCLGDFNLYYGVKFISLFLQFMFGNIQGARVNQL